MVIALSGSLNIERKMQHCRALMSRTLAECHDSLVSSEKLQWLLCCQRYKLTSMSIALWVKAVSGKLAFFSFLHGRALELRTSAEHQKTMISFECTLCLLCSQMQKLMSMSRDDIVVKALTGSFDKGREWPYCVGSPEGIKDQAYMPRQARLALALAGGRSWHSSSPSSCSSSSSMQTSVHVTVHHLMLSVVFLVAASGPC